MDADATEDKIELSLLRVATRIFYAVMGFGLSGMFGLGVFFATVNVTMARMEEDIAGLEKSMKNVERQVSKGILSGAERRVTELEKWQLDHERSHR